MDKHKELETPGAGLGGKFISLLGIILLVFACSPSNQAAEDLVKEVQELHKEVKALGEKLDKLEAGQQALLAQPKQPAPPPEAAALPPQPAPQLQPPAGAQPPAGPQPLTIAQLLAGKDQYLGSRVTVKGEAGPVLVHRKSLLLKSPQGMVEVLFGKLPDPMQVRRLTSTPIDQPITVTGVVSLPPRTTTGAAQLQINAEAIDF